MNNTHPKLVPQPYTNLLTERDVTRRPILETRHLGIDFGGLTAVSDFNIAIGATEIAGLIGPNGAGKTTIFNLLTNVYKPTRGSVLRREDDEGSRQVVGLAVHGDAVLFHRLEQRGLRLARGAVDLIREEEIGHDRAGLVDKGIRRFSVPNPICLVP